MNDGGPVPVSNSPAAVQLSSNIWKIYLYRMFSSFWLIAPILIPFYESNGLSSTEVFLIQSIYSLTILTLEIPTGYLSDRLGRKHTLLLGALFLPSGLAIYALSHSFLGFAIGEIVVAVSACLLSGTDSALLYDTLLELDRTDEHKRLEGTGHFFEQLGGSSASVLGGLLALISLRTPFYLNVLAASVLLPVAMAMIEPQRKRTSPKAGFSELFSIVRSTLRNDELRPLMFYSGLIGSTGIIGVWSYYLYYGQLGISVGYYGFLFAIFGFVSGLGGKWAHLIEGRLGKRLSMWLLLLISTTFLLLALFQSLALLPLIYLNGFLLGLSGPLFRDYINRIADSENRATVLSIGSLFSRVGFVMLSGLFGALIDKYSLSTAHLALAVLFFVVGLSCLLTRSLSRTMTEGP